MCDGQAADDCQIITLAEVETTLNERLAKLDDQFEIINDILKAKKEDFIKMYRSNPMTTQDDAVQRLQRTLESFNPMNPMEIPELEAVEIFKTSPITQSKQTIFCDSFSDDNCNAIILSCRRSVKGKNGNGYCFINHPKMQKNQILKWSLRVSKYKYDFLGMVIMPV